MSAKRFIITTLGYLVITFVLAILWHLVLFAETYEGIGYIAREEPIFAFGFLSILVQGLVLSYLYPRFSNGPLLIAIIGVYHWSMHVLSAAAKNQIAQLPLFFAIETIYLIVQFGLAVGLFTLVYRKH